MIVRLSLYKLTDIAELSSRSQSKSDTQRTQKAGASGNHIKKSMTLLSATSVRSEIVIRNRRYLTQGSQIGSRVRVSLCVRERERESLCLCWWCWFCLLDSRCRSRFSCWPYARHAAWRTSRVTRRGAERQLCNWGPRRGAWLGDLAIRQPGSQRASQPLTRRHILRRPHPAMSISLCFF